MKIGNLEFGAYPVFLAPMEDVTDIGFRLLCKRLGAAMVYSEFVAADALVRMVNRSLEKLASMRGQADEIILDVWNQVEARFGNLPAGPRLDKCREYGLIYYYRTGEKKPSQES